MFGPLLGILCRLQQGSISPYLLAAKCWREVRMLGLQSYFLMVAENVGRDAPSIGFRVQGVVPA